MASKFIVENKDILKYKSLEEKDEKALEKLTKAIKFQNVLYTQNEEIKDEKLKEAGLYFVRYTSKNKAENDDTQLDYFSDDMTAFSKIDKKDMMFNQAVFVKRNGEFLEDYSEFKLDIDSINDDDFLSLHYEFAKKDEPIFGDTKVKESVFFCSTESLEAGEDVQQELFDSWTDPGLVNRPDRLLSNFTFNNEKGYLNAVEPVNSTYHNYTKKQFDLYKDCAGKFVTLPLKNPKIPENKKCQFSTVSSSICSFENKKYSKEEILQVAGFSKEPKMVDVVSCCEEEFFPCFVVSESSSPENISKPYGFFTNKYGLVEFTEKLNDELELVYLGPSSAPKLSKSLIEVSTQGSVYIPFFESDLNIENIVIGSSLKIDIFTNTKITSVILNDEELEFERISLNHYQTKISFNENKKYDLKVEAMPSTKMDIGSLQPENKNSRVQSQLTFDDEYLNFEFSQLSRAPSPKLNALLNVNSIKGFVIEEFANSSNLKFQLKDTIFDFLFVNKSQSLVRINLDSLDTNGNKLQTFLKVGNKKFLQEDFYFSEIYSTQNLYYSTSKNEDLDETASSLPMSSRYSKNDKDILCLSFLAVSNFDIFVKMKKRTRKLVFHTGLLGRDISEQEVDASLSSVTYYKTLAKNRYFMSAFKAVKVNEKYFFLKNIKVTPVERINQVIISESSQLEAKIENSEDEAIQNAKKTYGDWLLYKDVRRLVCLGLFTTTSLDLLHACYNDFYSYVDFKVTSSYFNSGVKMSSNTITPSIIKVKDSNSKSAWEDSIEKGNVDVNQVEFPFYSFDAIYSNVSNTTFIDNVSIQESGEVKFDRQVNGFVYKDLLNYNIMPVYDFQFSLDDGYEDSDGYQRLDTNSEVAQFRIDLAKYDMRLKSESDDTFEVLRSVLQRQIENVERVLAVNEKVNSIIKTDSEKVVYNSFDDDVEFSHLSSLSSCVQDFQLESEEFEVHYFFPEMYLLGSTVVETILKSPTDFEFENDPSFYWYTFCSAGNCGNGGNGGDAGGMDLDQGISFGNESIAWKRKYVGRTGGSGGCGFYGGSGGRGGTSLPLIITMDKDEDEEESGYLFWKKTTTTVKTFSRFFSNSGGTGGAGGCGFLSGGYGGAGGSTSYVGGMIGVAGPNGLSFKDAVKAYLLWETFDDKSMREIVPSVSGACSIKNAYTKTLSGEMFDFACGLFELRSPYFEGLLQFEDENVSINVTLGDAGSDGLNGGTKTSAQPGVGASSGSGGQPSFLKSKSTFSARSCNEMFVTASSGETIEDGFFNNLNNIAVFGANAAGFSWWACPTPAATQYAETGTVVSVSNSNFFTELADWVRLGVAATGIGAILGFTGVMDWPFQDTTGGSGYASTPKIHAGLKGSLTSIRYAYKDWSYDEKTGVPKRFNGNANYFNIANATTPMLDRYFVEYGRGAGAFFSQDIPSVSDCTVGSELFSKGMPQDILKNGWPEFRSVGTGFNIKKGESFFADQRFGDFYDNEGEYLDCIQFSKSPDFNKFDFTLDSLTRYLKVLPFMSKKYKDLLESAAARKSYDTSTEKALAACKFGDEFSNFSVQVAGKSCPNDSSGCVIKFWGRNTKILNVHFKADKPSNLSSSDIAKTSKLSVDSRNNAWESFFTSSSRSDLTSFGDTFSNLVFGNEDKTGAVDTSDADIAFTWVEKPLVGQKVQTAGTIVAPLEVIN